MSLLINGQLRSDWLNEETVDGEFVRHDSQFRNWVTPDGRAGPSGESGFPAEPRRYHLYVSLACPWAHRTLIFRKLKRLEDVISVSVVNPHMGGEGWRFGGYPGATADTANGFDYLHQAYTLAQANYTGVVTVPVLWDKHRKTVVNNESAEIIRMFNSAFDACTEAKDDYYPPELRRQIDDINGPIYDHVNNGVYRCGFAATQKAYDKAFNLLFTTLDQLEQRLASQRFLVGDAPTEADWRLFTTLVRFDLVYFSHFKCNLRRVADYANLPQYMRDLYQVPGISQTVDIDHIKRHYYWSHETLNPRRIVPRGPAIDFEAPHDRSKFGLPG